MVRVMCPKSMKLEWANSIKKKEEGFRCTKCGDKHRAAKEA